MTPPARDPAFQVLRDIVTSETGTGGLQRVEVLLFEDDDDPPPEALDPWAPGSLVLGALLVFERVCIELMGDFNDDSATARVQRAPFALRGPPDFAVVDVTDRPPFAGLRGCYLQFFWPLRWNDELLEGLQLELAEPGERLMVLQLYMASGLYLLEVREWWTPG